MRRPVFTSQRGYQAGLAAPGCGREADGMGDAGPGGTVQAAADSIGQGGPPLGWG